MTKEERQSLWAARIAEYKASGQSVKTWCAEHDVSPQQLWYWLKKEKQTSSESTTPSWLPLNLSNDADTRDSLLVRVGQVAVEVRSGFDPTLLLDVVNTLKHND